MDKFDMVDVVASLYFRRQLVSFDEKKLTDFFTKNENYSGFLYILDVTLQIDCVFLLFDLDIVDILSNIVNKKRFEYKDEDTIDRINRIIYVLNGYRHMSDFEIELHKEEYKFYQSDTRGFKVDNDQMINDLIMNDVSVFEAITNNDFSNVVDCRAFLSSILFLLSYMPQLFISDTIRKNVCDFVKDVENGKYKLNRNDKKYLKQFKKSFNDIRIIKIEE